MGGISLASSTTDAATTSGADIKQMAAFSQAGGGDINRASKIGNRAAQSLLNSFFFVDKKLSDFARAHSFQAGRARIALLGESGGQVVDLFVYNLLANGS